MCFYHEARLTENATLDMTTHAAPPQRVRYAIVGHEGGHMTGNQEELSERCLVLHEGLAHGDVVEVLDTWCDRSYPGSILSSSAFTKARPCPRRSSLYVLAQLVYMLAQLVYACAASPSLLRLHILPQGMGKQHGQLVQPMC